MTVWQFFLYKIRENVQYKVGLFLFIHFILFIELILSLVGDLPWGLASPTLATQAVPGISFSSKIFFQVGSSAFHFDFFLGGTLQNFLGEADFRRFGILVVYTPVSHADCRSSIPGCGLWVNTWYYGFKFSGFLVRSSYISSIVSSKLNLDNYFQEEEEQSRPHLPSKISSQAVWHQAMSAGNCPCQSGIEKIKKYFL